MDWKSKLSSRKFWAAVAAFVTSIMTYNKAADPASQVTSIIMAGGSLIAYIFAEGWVDSTRNNSGAGDEE